MSESETLGMASVRPCECEGHAQNTASVRSSDLQDITARKN